MYLNNKFSPVWSVRCYLTSHQFVILDLSMLISCPLFATHAPLIFISLEILNDSSFVIFLTKWVIWFSYSLQSPIELNETRNRTMIMKHMTTSLFERKTWSYHHIDLLPRFERDFYSYKKSTYSFCSFRHTLDALKIPPRSTKNTTEIISVAMKAELGTQLSLPLYVEPRANQIFFLSALNFILKVLHLQHKSTYFFVCVCVFL